MLNQFRPAIVCFILLTCVTGVVYPLIVTGIAKAAFPRQSEGGLIPQHGSQLIGQPFDDPRYFWGRPSMTAPTPYNAAASSGSNLGPSNPTLIDAVKVRVDALKAADPTNLNPIPVDLVTSSASGLDPHISPAAAQFQAERVAGLRHMAPAGVRELIARHTQSRQFGLLGEPRVNVLELNIDLDRTQKDFETASAAKINHADAR